MEEAIPPVEVVVVVAPARPANPLERDLNHFTRNLPIRGRLPSLPLFVFEYSTVFAHIATGAMYAPPANQLAAEIVRISTEEQPQIPERSAISEYLAQIGRKGGLKGGVARAQALSPRKRSSIAARAARARWGKPSKPR